MKKHDLIRQESTLQVKLANFMEKRAEMSKEIEDLTAAMLFDLGGKLDVEEEGDLLVSYDGGNHPEYASDMYASVESVRMVGGSFEVSLRNSEPDIYADRLTFDDICAVHDYVAAAYKESNSAIAEAIDNRTL